MGASTALDDEPNVATLVALIKLHSSATAMVQPETTGLDEATWAYQRPDTVRPVMFIHHTDLAGEAAHWSAMVPAQQSGLPQPSTEPSESEWRSAFRFHLSSSHLTI